MRLWAFVVAAFALIGPSAIAARTPGGPPAPAGVEDPQRAWQAYVLNCQGCHRPDGSGGPTSAPPLAGHVAAFVRTPEGRAYLGRVPGVADAPLSDADLAELLNWMLWRFDPGELPSGFRAYTAAEIRRLRRAPLRTEAASVRAAVLKAP